MKYSNFLERKKLQYLYLKKKDTCPMSFYLILRFHQYSLLFFMDLVDNLKVH